MSSSSNNIKISLTNESMTVISNNNKTHESIDDSMCDDSMGDESACLSMLSVTNSSQSNFDSEYDKFETPNSSDDEMYKETQISKQKYIKYMNSIVDQIKNMNWGDTITFDSEYYNHDVKKKLCLINKNIRYDTYIFKGRGSKCILKYFMNKTKNDPNYGYTKIAQILDNKQFRRFFPIKNWNCFWKIYKNEPIKNRRLFEIIRSDQPCKPYLDIEWIVGNNENAKKINYESFVCDLKHDITHVFKKRYGIRIADKNILIASSHSNVKASFHVIIDESINNETVAYKTNRKGLPDSAWDLWMGMITYNNKYKTILDETVYSLDREFRAVYSNKSSEYRPVVPFGTHIKKNANDCLKYFVTYSPSNKYHFIVTPETSSNTYFFKKYYTNDIFIPSIYSDDKINYLIQLLKPYHQTAEYTGPSPCGGWRFSYHNKDELCYTGNRHKSNGFYVFEDTDRKIIYMKCMSNKCNGIQILVNNNKSVNKSIKLF